MRTATFHSGLLKFFAPKVTKLLETGEKTATIQGTYKNAVEFSVTVKSISDGSFSTVYKVIYTALGQKKTYALKVATTGKERKELSNELKAQQALCHLPGNLFLTSLADLKTSDFSCMLMPLAEGDLFQFHFENGSAPPINANTCLELNKYLVELLNQLKEKKLVLGDIKPENIVRMTLDGTLKTIDVASLSRSDIRVGDAPIVGTELYASLMRRIQVRQQSSTTALKMRAHPAIRDENIEHFDLDLGSFACIMTLFITSALFNAQPNGQKQEGDQTTFFTHIFQLYRQNFIEAAVELLNDTSKEDNYTAYQEAVKNYTDFLDKLKKDLKAKAHADTTHQDTFKDLIDQTVRNLKIELSKTNELIRMMAPHNKRRIERAKSRTELFSDANNYRNIERENKRDPKRQKRVAPKALDFPTPIQSSHKL